MPDPVDLALRDISIAIAEFAKAISKIMAEHVIDQNWVNEEFEADPRTQELISMEYEPSQVSFEHLTSTKQLESSVSCEQSEEKHD
jgi:hypothetical protein